MREKNSGESIVPDTTYNDLPCPVCDSKENTVLYPDTLNGQMPNFDYKFTPDHHRTFQTVRCARCRHVYSSPLPSDIWKNYLAVVEQDYLQHSSCRVATSDKVCAVLRRHVPGGRLLDIGCATGDFLSVAQRFYNVEGLELSEWSAKLARERGFTIHSKFLSEFTQASLYDVVTLWGVIEHFESPRDEIRQVFRLLKPGGIVALWTGDVDGLCSRLLGKRWWNIQGQHIQDFTKSSLTMLFQNIGFQKTWIGRYPYVMSRDAILLSLGRYPAVHNAVRPVVRKVLSPRFHLTVALPGELFAVFRKPLTLEAQS